MEIPYQDPRESNSRRTDPTVLRLRCAVDPQLGAGEISKKNRSMCLDPGRVSSAGAQAAKKDLTGPVNYEMIPYNLKRKENYGLFSFKNTC